MPRRIVKLVLGKDHIRRVTVDVPLTLAELRQKVIQVCDIRNFEVLHRTSRGDLAVRTDADVRAAFELVATGHVRLLIRRCAPRARASSAPAADEKRGRPCTAATPPVVSQPGPLATDPSASSQDRVPPRRGTPPAGGRRAEEIICGVVGAAPSGAARCLMDPCPSPSPPVQSRPAAEMTVENTNRTTSTAAATASATSTATSPAAPSASSERPLNVSMRMCRSQPLWKSQVHNVDKDVFDSTVAGLDAKLRESLDIIHASLVHLDGVVPPQALSACKLLAQVARRLRGAAREMRSLNSELAARNAAAAVASAALAASSATPASEPPAAINVDPATHELVISVGSMPSGAAARAPSRRSLVITAKRRNRNGRTLRADAKTDANIDAKTDANIDAKTDTDSEAADADAKTSGVVILSSEDIMCVSQSGQAVAAGPRVDSPATPPVQPPTAPSDGKTPRKQPRRDAADSAEGKSPGKLASSCTTDIVHLQRPASRKGPEFEAKMRRLEEMGWTRNPTFNRVLLEINNGDLEKVLEDLRSYDSVGTAPNPSDT